MEGNVSRKQMPCQPITTTALCATDSLSIYVELGISSYSLVVAVVWPGHHAAISKQLHVTSNPFQSFV
jgi:hypothetical protein